MRANDHLGGKTTNFYQFLHTNNKGTTFYKNSHSDMKEGIVVHTQVIAIEYCESKITKGKEEKNFTEKSVIFCFQEKIVI